MYLLDVLFHLKACTIPSSGRCDGSDTARKDKATERRELRC